MANRPEKDDFTDLHDEYENCDFCSQKYKGYSIFKYSKGRSIDIDFYPKKMDELGIVVDAAYELAYFEAKHPRVFKDQGAPDDIRSYADNLKYDNLPFKKDKKVPRAYK